MLAAPAPALSLVSRHGSGPRAGRHGRLGLPNDARTWDIAVREWALVLLWALLLLLLIAWALTEPAGAAGPCDTSLTELALSQEEIDAWNAINDYRAANGKTRLVWTPSLVKSATWMAIDMSYVVGSQLNHSSRDGRGPYARMKDCGYVASPWMGENIAAGYTTGAQVFNGWKGSSAHNIAMLSADLRVGGVARYYREGSSWGTYWALNLGGASENVDGKHVHPEIRWKWICPLNVCERVQ